MLRHAPSCSARESDVTTRGAWRRRSIDGPAMVHMLHMLHTKIGRHELWSMGAGGRFGGRRTARHRFLVGGCGSMHPCWTRVDTSDRRRRASPLGPATAELGLLHCMLALIRGPGALRRGVSSGGRFRRRRHRSYRGVGPRTSHPGPISGNRRVAPAGPEPLFTAPGRGSVPAFPRGSDRASPSRGDRTASPGTRMRNPGHRTARRRRLIGRANEPSARRLRQPGGGRPGRHRTGRPRDGRQPARRAAGRTLEFAMPVSDRPESRTPFIPIEAPSTACEP
jgi:hypothetical protein